MCVILTPSLRNAKKTILRGLLCLGFKPQGMFITDNLKYIDRIERHERCVTGNKRIDLKQKSGPGTEKSKLKRKDGHDMQGTRKEQKVMKPQKLKQKVQKREKRRH